MRMYLLPWKPFSENLFNMYCRFHIDIENGYFYVIRDDTKKWISVGDQRAHDTLEEAMMASDIILEECGYILLNERTVLLV
jgi:hypothetical protein